MAQIYNTVTITNAWEQAYTSPLNTSTDLLRSVTTSATFEGTLDVYESFACPDGGGGTSTNIVTLTDNPTSGIAYAFIKAESTNSDKVFIFFTDSNGDQSQVGCLDPGDFAFIPLNATTAGGSDPVLDIYNESGDTQTVVAFVSYK